MSRIKTLMLRPFAVACLVAVASLGWTAFVAAQVPHTFSNGEVADADKMNQNFTALADALATLSGAVTLEAVESGEILVDCSTDADALSKIVDSEPATRLNQLDIVVTGGNCNFPLGVDYAARSIFIVASASQEGLELVFPTDNQVLSVKNGHLYLEGFVLNEVSSINLWQHASLQLTNVSFTDSGSPRPRILVRSNSLLRLFNSFESANSSVRPDIYVTNSEFRLLNPSKTAVLGNVDLAMNATFWCRYCQIDAEALRLDTNSSFCGYADDVDGNGQELGIDSLSVRAGSVFLHDGAPASSPSYATNVTADSVAIWDDSTRGGTSRCLYR